MSEQARELAALLQSSHRAAVRAGWWSDLKTGQPLDRNKAEMLCLIHSEISEAWFATRIEAAKAEISGLSNLEQELADILIRAGDYAGGFGYTIDPHDGVSLTVCDQSWLGLHNQTTQILEAERRGMTTGVKNALLSELVGTVWALARAGNRDIFRAIRLKMAYNAKRADHKIENRRAASGKKF